MSVILSVWFFQPLFFTQTIPLNKYGLPVVSDYSTYREMAQTDSNYLLIDVQELIAGIVVDMPYATTANFTHQKLYPEAKAFLRYPAARALQAVRNDLLACGLDLKIYDAYRPYQITELMWDIVQNEDFVASPKNGSRHNRGCAVDVTLINAVTHDSVPMPTAYDDFTGNASDTCMTVSDEAIVNRRILREAMERSGFRHLSSEWWHFDFVDWKKYPVTDIPFEKLKEQ